MCTCTCLRSFCIFSRIRIIFILSKKGFDLQDVQRKRISSMWFLRIKDLRRWLPMVNIYPILFWFLTRNLSVVICSFATLESPYLQFRLFILLFMLQRCSIPFCCNYGGYWIPFSMEGCHKMPRSTDHKTLRTEWQRTCLSPAFCRQWLHGNPRIENVYILTLRCLLVVNFLLFLRRLCTLRW